MVLLRISLFHYSYRLISWLQVDRTKWGTLRGRQQDSKDLSLMESPTSEQTASKDFRTSSSASIKSLTRAISSAYSIARSWAKIIDAASYLPAAPTSLPSRLHNILIPR